MQNFVIRPKITGKRNTNHCWRNSALDCCKTPIIYDNSSAVMADRRLVSEYSDVHYLPLQQLRNTNTHKYQPCCRSGLVVSKSEREVPGSNPHIRQFQWLRYTAPGTGCTLIALSTLTRRTTFIRGGPKK